MEENGINLGRNVQPMPYHDVSTTPSSLRHFDHTTTTHAHVPITAQAFEAASPSAPGALAHAIGIAPAPESRFFPRTVTDDYLDAMHAALQRGDTAACSALTQQHMQLPHMQERQEWGRQLYEAEQQRQQEEQRRLDELRRQEELERQQWLDQQQQQERSRGRSR